MRGSVKDLKEKAIKMKLAIILSVLSVLCVIGGTYAWFANTHRLKSITPVQVPSKITISGSKRSEMTRINLELTEEDTKNDTTVTINRVFCIESSDDYYLEVAHTTNISNMQIQIFPVSAANSEQSSGSKAGGWISSGDGTGTAYYYKPDNTALAGSYLNKNGSIANNTYHSENYAADDTYQENAEPLYWVTNTAEDFDREDYSRTGKAGDGVTDICYRYYVLQLKWDSSTLETDLVYLMARNPEV